MSNIPIDKRLFGVFSKILVLILMLLLLLISQSHRYHQRMEHMLHVNNAKLAIGFGIEQAVTEMQGAQRGLMLAYEANDVASAPLYISLYATSGAKVDQLMRELRPLAESDDERQILSQIQNNRDIWSPRFTELIRLCKSGQVAQAYQLRNQNKIISAAMHASAAQLLQLQNQELSEAEQEASIEIKWSNWSIAFAGGLSLLFAVAVVMIVRKIIGGLKGSLTVLNASASQISGGASQIANSSHSLAQGTSSQAASIEETSAAAEQINAMAKKNSDNARRASELMDQTHKVVNEANRSLGEMQLSMNEITEASSEVGKIIKVIEQIAFQTNILALNAAVESARAGEAGMGFAVVADEVRTLARRSAKAAEDTALLIEESISRSRLGHSRLEVVTRAIHGITEGTRNAGLLVGEVKTGSDEQAKGALQIARAMSDIEKVTQNSAAHAEEGAATGQQMNGEVESLKAVVETLHAMVG